MKRPEPSSVLKIGNTTISRYFFPRGKGVEVTTFGGRSDVVLLDDNGNTGNCIAEDLTDEELDVVLTAANLEKQS